MGNDLKTLLNSIKAPEKSGAYATFNTSDNDEGKNSILSKRISSSSLPLYQTKELDKSYRDKGIVYNIHDDQQDYDRQRAEKQSGIEQFSNFIVQGLTSEIALGGIKAFSDLTDAVYNLFSNEDNDYTNPISLGLEKAQDYVREKFPIYRKNPNDAFDISDSGWWYGNAVNLATTLSLLIPSKTVMTGVKLLSKIPKLASATNKTTRALAIFNPARLNRNVSKARAIAAGSRNIKEFGNLSIGALASRTAENYMEAREVWKESKDRAKNEMINWDNNDWKTFFENNPNLENEYKDENGNINIEGLSDFIAGESADKTFAQDYWMLGMDMLQLKSLSKMSRIGLPTSKNTYNSTRTYIAQKNALKRLAGESDEQLIKNTFLNRRKAGWEMFKEHPIKRSYNLLSRLQVGEGFEEAFQGTMTEKGKEVAEKYLNPNFTERDLYSYVSDPHIWEQAVWGMVGGVVYQTGGKYLNKLSDYKTSKRTDKETNFSWLASAEEKIKIGEIERRQQRLNEFKNRIEALNRGFDPDGKILDSAGKELTDESGQPLYKPISGYNLEQQKLLIERLKEQEINSFVADLTMDAIDTGNYNLLQDYLNSNEFNSYLKTNKLEEIENRNLNNQIKNQMKDVHNYYIENISSIIDVAENTEDGGNQFVARIAAKELTEKQLLVDEFNKVAKEKELELQTYQPNNKERLEEINKYKLYSRYKQALNEVNNLYKEKSNIIGNNKLSVDAKNEYLREIDKKINSIYNSLNLTVNQEKSQLTQLEEKVNELTQNYNISNTDKQKVDYIEYIKLSSTTYDATLPKLANDYKNQYEKYARGLDAYTRARYEKAVDRVKNWIENQQDLNKAKELLYEKDNSLSNELKDDLLLLKLGHKNYKEYTKDIDDFIENEKAKRNQQTIESNTTIDNGTPRNITKKEQEALNKNIEEIENKLNENELNQFNTNYKKIAKTLKNYLKNITSGKTINNKGLNNTLESARKLIEKNDNNNLNVVTDEFRNNYKNLVYYSNTGELLNLDNIENINEDNENIVPSTGEQVEDTTIEYDENEVEQTQPEIISYLEEIEPSVENKEQKERIANLYKDFINREQLEKFAKEITDINFNSHLNEFIKYLKEQQIPDVYINEYAKDAIISRLSILKYINRNNVQYENLRNFLSSFQSLSALSNINFEEYEKQKEVIESIIKDILNEYSTKYEVGENDIINIKELFDYFINYKKLLDYNNDVIINVFNGLLDYVTKNKNKFSNRILLLNYKNNPELLFQEFVKSNYAQILLDGKFHINIPSKYYKNSEEKEEFIEWVSSLDENKKVEVKYTRRKTDADTTNILDGDLVETSKELATSIGLFVDGKSIGYISTVTQSPDGNSYNISVIGSGFLTTVTNENGNIVSNLQPLFDVILDDNNSELYEFLKYKKYGSIDDNYKEEYSNYEQNLYKIINDLLKERGLYLQNIYKTKNGADHLEINKKLIKDINKILFFGKENVTKEDRKYSIQAWFDKVYDNYKTTHDIFQQQILSGDKTKVVTISNVAKKRLIIKNENTDVKDVGFDYEKNPIVIVENENSIVAENDNQSYTNIGFKTGAMGFMIEKVENKPIMALFTEVNLLDLNTKFGKAVEKEINNLLTDFYNGKLNFDKLYDNLNALIGNNKDSLFGKTLVFKNVITNKGKTSNRITISLPNGSFINIFSKINGSDVKIVNYKNKNYKSFNKIAKDIASGLQYNRTFYYIKHKNTPEINETSNKYLQKNKDGIVIKVGGEEFKYKNFGHFVLENNAFKTNTVKENNSFTFIDESVEGIYLAINDSPVEGKELLDTVSIQQFIENSKGAINTKEILDKLGYTKEEQDLLLGTNTGVELVPNEFRYDNNRQSNGAYYRGKIYLGVEGLKRVLNNKYKLQEILIHEQIHKKFRDLKGKEKTRIVDGLLDIYDKFIEYLNNDNSVEAEALKIWINNNNFRLIENKKEGEQDYFDTINKDELSFEEKKQIFAEEFLAESLSRTELINYLNNASYNTSDIFDDIEDNKKSLWQKLIEFLLKLFGKTTKNINKNSILAEEYKLLGNQSLEDITTKITDNTKDIKEESKTDNITENNTDNLIETNEVEELEESNDFELASVLEDVIDFDNSSNHDNTINIVSMDAYLDRFSSKDKALIADNIKNGDISFYCR